MTTKKILIVDDDVAILDSLGLLLDFEGFDVKAFDRGSEVFKCIDTSCKPDAILLDMWLSEEDGRDICKQLKEQENTKNIPVIIMSASRGLEHTAVESGADAFVAKPFEIDEIIEKIHHFTA